MKAFFRSHAGKGTLAVYFAALVVAYPPALALLAGGAAFVFAIHEFRQSFRQISREAAERPQEEAVDAVAAVTVAANGEGHLPAVIVNGHAVGAVLPAGQGSEPGWPRARD
jgi:hypothetical protein